MDKSRSMNYGFGSAEGRQGGGERAGLSVETAELRELDGNRSFLQSGFWASFRRQLGWRPRAFRCRYRDAAFLLLVLVRPLGAGFSLAYVPHGPEVPDPRQGREKLLLDLAGALRPRLRGCVFLRFDLPWGKTGAGELPGRLEASKGLYKAPMDIQPPSTVLIDLGGDEQDLLARMKSKTRYNIRLAARKGVQVSAAGDLAPGMDSADSLRRAVTEWYRLYVETARRDRITLHSESYYRKLFDLAAGYGTGAPELHLLVARHQGELLGGIIVALRGERSWYLYGASSSRKRNLMPAYALQWQAIRLARQRGCRQYDLFGIPADDDPAQPMHGLYRFKTGFGGTILNRLGCYDVPFRLRLYRAYRLAEAVRTFYFRRWRKRPRR